MIEIKGFQIRQKPARRDEQHRKIREIVAERGIHPITAVILMHGLCSRTSTFLYKPYLLLVGWRQIWKS
jgi:hypothetical protein